jgi:hypothetical protein
VLLRDRASRERHDCFGRSEFGDALLNTFGDGITITAEAYAAIKATLPADTQTWPPSPGDLGDVVIWLDQAMLDRLEATRGPGESYFDAIIRVARA